MKAIQKAHLYKHLHKIKKRHIERIIHTRTHTHHTMVHMGELLIVGILGFSSLLFANYNNSYQHLHRNNNEEINKFLAEAIQQEKQKENTSKIISVREMDGKVNNTFAAGYCTYGAARISPEFFPYSEDKMSQERTRGGNAIDRCENAEKAGFKIGKTPNIGALIVYKKIGTNTTFGHVGKILYYNNNHESLIIRDMNRIGKFIMSDHWETAKNENIKCYIYPQKATTEINIPNQIHEKFPTTTINIQPITTNTTTNKQHNSPTTTSQETQPPQNNIQTIIQPQESIQEPENNTFYNTISDNEEIHIETQENFSDIAKHFLSQYEMKINIPKKRTMLLGEKIAIKITIINKKTKEPYQGILPFIFNSISETNAIESSLKTIQLIHEQENIFYLKAKEKGESTIILTIDNEEIKKIDIKIL